MLNHCAHLTKNWLFLRVREFCHFVLLISTKEVFAEYGVRSIQDISALRGNHYEAVILAVAHRDFRTLNIADLHDGTAVVYDIKGILPEDQISGRL